MNLVLRDRTWDLMSQFFGTNRETLENTFRSLGISNNLIGEIVGDRYIAKSGETFSYNSETRKIDGKVSIVDLIAIGNELTGNIKLKSLVVTGVPMTIQQRDQLLKHLPIKV